MPRWSDVTMRRGDKAGHVLGGIPGRCLLVAGDSEPSGQTRECASPAPSAVIIVESVMRDE